MFILDICCMVWKCIIWIILNLELEQFHWIVAAMTKEERVQRDLEQMPKKRCASDEEERQAKQDISKVLTSGEADGK
jgi:hypothetical protein